MLSPTPSFCSSFTVLSEVSVNEKITLALNYLKDYELRTLSKHRDLIRIQAENGSTYPSRNPIEGTGSTLREKLRDLIMMRKAPTNGNFKVLQIMNLNHQNAMANRIKITEATVELSEIKIDIKYLEQMMQKIMDDKLVTIPFKDRPPPLGEDKIEEFEKIAGSVLFKWKEREKNKVKK
ncbi:hypothetical protein EYC80_001545 [Monilinia laxa]|uniref:Uncharacterized protein n=1 Tax=Monilinia laxa TaxID=61186 RepID=A0A5N6K591_MONLA|nr:hypothetical protein EYC80_001545 [Monilinia laxa]